MDATSESKAVSERKNVIVKGSMIIVLIAIGALFSCTKSETDNGHAVKIRLYSCARPMISGAQVQLCFDSLITDSRCPCNAVCGWRGFAAGKFSFSVNGQTHLLRLAEIAIRPFPKDTTIAGYRIELVDLKPYPCWPDNTDEIEEAEMKITKL